ncbi:hypothetical protein D3C84_1006500 [compost metagenome]
MSSPDVGKNEITIGVDNEEPAFAAHVHLIANRFNTAVICIHLNNAYNFLRILGAAKLSYNREDLILRVLNDLLQMRGYEDRFLR